jgi:hypothetical protein
MEKSQIPGVARERVSRLTGSRVAVAIVFDRDIEASERDNFYRLSTSDTPVPEDFSIEGRVIRYECEAEEADKWRLALEIYLVKAFRTPPTSPRRETGIRARAGFRKLHLG